MLQIYRSVVYILQFPFELSVNSHGWWWVILIIPYIFTYNLFVLCTKSLLISRTITLSDCYSLVSYKNRVHSYVIAKIPALINISHNSFDILHVFTNCYPPSQFRNLLFQGIKTIINVDGESSQYLPFLRILFQ